MTTPNDLPSVGTEDATGLNIELQIIAGFMHDPRPRSAINRATELLRSLVSERDELASRVRELEGDGATIAGLESAVGHLSAMFDEHRRLLVEVEQVCGRDAYGLEFEDGDSELIDKVRAHLAATTSDASKCSKTERGAFEVEIRKQCFQKPTPEAYDSAWCMWSARAALNASKEHP